MRAQTDHPVHELLAARWSPYGYSSRPVADAELRSLFEAARWAPSSYNEQPWAFIVARREDRVSFNRLLSCLMEANQVWAQHAPALALGLASARFTGTGQPNRHAFYDLGQAAASLSLEAASRGLCVHQMAGVDPDRARAACGVPEGWQVVTAMAMGHPGEPDGLPVDVRARDAVRRGRKPLSDFVFSGSWGKAPDFVD